MRRAASAARTRVESPQMTRAWIFLSLIACAEGPRRPRQLPPDPNAVENCRSSPSPLGGVRYTCGDSYQVLDNTYESLAMRTVEYDLVKRAREAGYEVESRPAIVEGSDSALVVHYRDMDGHAIDVIALKAVSARVRFLQCNVLWFKGSRSRATREASCARTLSLLLQRPAPAGRELTAECKQAT